MHACKAGIKTPKSCWCMAFKETTPAISLDEFREFNRILTEARNYVLQLNASFGWE